MPEHTQKRTAHNLRRDSRFPVGEVRTREAEIEVAKGLASATDSVRKAERAIREFVRAVGFTAEELSAAFESMVEEARRWKDPTIGRTP